MNRRQAIIGTAVLPLMPASSLAKSTNMTDATWTDYQAAKAEIEVVERAYTALPSRRLSPN